MKRVKEFLKEHWDGKSPLLVGYSGGPDSKALLYSLLESGCGTLHVAHIDHGWREESAEEAESICQEMKGLGVVFHTLRLPSVPLGNKEAVFREERLKFFFSLFEKIPFQALLLGHHADDLAETSLKRLLEGAHLPFLGGMEPISSLEGMPIWRPLLKIKKKELFRFLEKRQLQPFFDSTNFDPLYLRARLRKETLPFLQDSFGKNVMENLCHLSERAHELRRYLDQKVSSAQKKKGEWGFVVCCTGLQRIERRHLLQKVASSEGIFLTRTVLEPVLDWVEDAGKMRKIFFGGYWVVSYLDFVLFLRSDEKRAFPENSWKGFLCL